MGERTTYAPGTISWTDLATTDPEGAKAFYGALFGWEAIDEPADAGAHTMCRLRGHRVAGIHAQSEEQRLRGVPPHWLSYVSVDDLDASAGRVDSLGGALLVPPLDVTDQGRMALAQDPTGAAFALWEPRTHAGAGLVNEPGAMSWNQLNTRDIDTARSFYGDLLGWTTDEQEAPAGVTYYLIRNGQKLNGGMLQMIEEWGDISPHWMTYFAVEDCDAAVARVGELGGQVPVAPVDSPVGRFWVLSDPQGATFAVIAGRLDP